MNRDAPAHRNLWALTVLCLLRGGPLHPYEIQRLIYQRHKDKLLDLRRGSLYHAVEQLRRAGLIEPVETRRSGRRPEHTVYRLTPAGEAEVVVWLREILMHPVSEPSQFLAGVSYLSRLTPQEALDALHRRVDALEAEVVGLETALRGESIERHPALRTLGPQMARLVLLEAEYVRALRRAELEWVRSVVADIEQGRLTWSYEDLLRAAHGTATEPAESADEPI